MIRRVFWGITTGVLLVLILVRISGLVERKSAYQKNSDFMEQSEDLDVLFLGTSHVINGVFPMELWKEYGITSYNLSGHAHSIPTSYWVMMNALDYAHPRLVVMDCYRLESDGKDSKSFAHISFDSLPFSANKVKAIWDLYDTADERVEYLCNFSLYHSRWWDVGADDFVPVTGYEKGAELKNTVVRVEQSDSIDADRIEKRTIDSTGTVYLRKILEECRKRKIEVLLTYLPFEASEKDRISAGYVEEIARQYDVGYINFLDLNVIDRDTDYADESTHLNLSGAERVTRYLGNYIQQYYDIADRRKDKLAEQWDEDYREYMAYKIQRISNLETLQNCLIALTDPNLSCCIYVDDRAGIWNSDGFYERLIRNLARGQELSGLEEAVQEREPYLLLLDRVNGEIVEKTGRTDLEVETSFGRVCYTSEGVEGRELRIGETEKNLLAFGEGDQQPTVTIAVVNDLDHSVVYVGEFYDMHRVYRE